MTRRYLRQLSLMVLFVLPGSTAIAQNGRFDLEKTKRVLTGVIEKTLAENGVPSMSIALVRGDSIVWKATPPAQSEIVYAALKLLRGESYVPRPPQKGIAVDEKLLNSYVGTYDLGRINFVVSRVGKALAIQQNGGAINELIAETPTRFLLRGSNFKVTFEGDSGSIDRLVVDAGSQHLTATRRK